jgi:hypothetical protein
MLALGQVPVVDNGSQLAYSVSIIGLKNNRTHIHNGIKGQNGDIVAVLSNGKSADVGMRLYRGMEI